jgi:Zn-dependent protease
MQAVDSVFYIVVLIMSIVVHEFAHGYSAYLLGDNTARLSGRLTLNPIKHLDLFGSVLLPLILIISGSGFVIGWAKPVPYNPRNLRNERKGTFIVSISGILANLFVALFFSFLIRLSPYVFDYLNIGASFAIAFYKISSIVVILNLVLALFNLMPVPPLDGSKLLFSVLPEKIRRFEDILERWGILVLIFFVLFIWPYISPLIFKLFTILTSISF